MKGMVSKLQTIGMLIALVSAIGGGFYTWGTFNQRLDVIEKNVIKIEKKKFVVNETVDLSGVHKEIKIITTEVNKEIKEVTKSLNTEVSLLKETLNTEIGLLKEKIQKLEAEIKINSAGIDYVEALIQELKVQSNNPLLQQLIITIDNSYITWYNIFMVKKEKELLEKQLEFDFNQLKEKKEKQRKEKFNLPEHPLDNLLKDK